MKKTLAVPELLRAGLTPTEIAAQLGISRCAVYKIKKKLKDTGTASRKPGSGRAQSVRTKKLIDKVKRRIKTNPVRSMRKMARELDVSRSSMQRLIKNDLNMKSRARVKVPLLTEAQQESRFSRSKVLLNNVKHAAAGRAILFSDEKIFTVNAILNRRNDRWIGGGPSDVPDNVKYTNTTKHPASVMVFGLISSDGKKMPPVFIPSGVRINTDKYLAIMNDKVKPWILANYPDGNYVFQQDGAPAHTSKRTQEWLDANLQAFWSKDMWPPQSPDLNPLDYSIWATVEDSACKKPHPSVAALERSIVRSWEKMTASYIKKTCQVFRRRLEAVVTLKGGHIEK